MGQTEQWYWINKEGRLINHWEMDGHACLRHGCCPRDEPVDVARLTEDQARDVVRRLVAILHELQQERRAAR